MIQIRKVIAGRVYDTATATLVHVCVDVRHRYLFNKNEWTGLFRTQKGQWFLAGAGAVGTRWRQRAKDDLGFVEGAGLRLITPEQARKFLEEHEGPVEDHFEVEQG